MKRPVDDCVPMRCAVCTSCCRARNANGGLTMGCVYGGPFAGYADAAPGERPSPALRACRDGVCPIKPQGEG